MKLQGVNILRITDFRRFFDYTEFENQKKEFVKLLKSENDIKLFCDTEEEEKICKYVIDWIKGGESCKQIIFEDNSKFSLNRDKYKLGRLSNIVPSLREKISPNNVGGLLFLYLLLGADKEDSDITLDFDFLLSSPHYDCLHNDKEYESVKLPEYPLSRRIVANIGNKAIKVKYGNEEIELLPEACAVALFSSEGKCFKILPHTLSNNNGLTLYLKFNRKNHVPYMEIHDKSKDVKIIEGVYSMALDNRRGVYLDAEGVLTYLNGTCYAIKNVYENFKSEEEKNEVLLAFERSDEGYIFYTNIRKLDENDLV